MSNDEPLHYSYELASETHDELTQLEENMKKQITNLQNKKKTTVSPEKTLKLLIEKYRQLLALKKMADASDVTTLKEWLFVHKQEFDNLKNQYELYSGKEFEDELETKKKKKAAEKAAAATNNNNASNVATDEQQNADAQQMEQELFAPIFKLQQNTLEVVRKMNAKAEETIQIGTEASERLLQQEEKLKKIDAQLDDLGAATTRAKKEMVAFARALSRDKCIVILILMCVLAFVFVIIVGTLYGIFKKPIDALLQKKQQNTQ